MTSNAEDGNDKAATQSEQKNKRTAIAHEERFVKALEENAFKEEQKQKGQSARIIKTVDQCFEYAKAEYPERDSLFDPDMLVMKAQDDPHEKKTEKLTHVENVCAMTLHGRTFDLILSKILAGNEEKATPELNKVLNEPHQSFPSPLCTVQDIKDYFDNCLDKTENDN